MTPTNKLRFVSKIVFFDKQTNFAKTEKVLQQWWAVERDGQQTPDGEWRDVPIEKE